MKTKKNWRVITVAVVFGLALLTFVVYHTIMRLTASNAESNEPNNKTITTPITKDKGQITHPVVDQNPTIDDYDTCEHIWAEWTISTQDGKQVTIMRCTKNEQHLLRIETDIITQPEPTKPSEPVDPVEPTHPTDPSEPEEPAEPVTPIVPSFTLDAEHLHDTTWQSDGIQLVFAADGKYRFGNTFGVWDIIDQTTIRLINASDGLPLGYEFTFTLDTTAATPNLRGDFFGTDYTFVLTAAA